MRRTTGHHRETSELTKELLRSVKDGTSREWDEVLLDFNEHGRQFCVPLDAEVGCHSLFGMLDWLRAQQERNRHRDFRRRLLWGSKVRQIRLRGKICRGRGRGRITNAQILKTRKIVEALGDDSQRISRLIGTTIEDVETLRSLWGLHIQLTVWCHQYFEANKPRQEVAGTPCAIRFIQYLAADYLLGPRYFVTAGDDGYVKLFETETAIMSISLKRHFWSLSCPVLGPLPLGPVSGGRSPRGLSPGGLPVGGGGFEGSASPSDPSFGSILISGCLLGHVRIWILEPRGGCTGWRPSTVISLDGSVVKLEAFRVGGRCILATVSDRGTVNLYDLEKLLRFCTPKDQGGVGAPYGSICREDYGCLYSIKSRLPGTPTPGIVFGVLSSNVQQTKLGDSTLELYVTLSFDLNISTITTPERQPGGRGGGESPHEYDNDSESLRFVSRSRRLARKAGFVQDPSIIDGDGSEMGGEGRVRRRNGVVPSSGSSINGRSELLWHSDTTPSKMPKSIGVEVALDLETGQGDVKKISDLSHYPAQSNGAAIPTQQLFDGESSKMIVFGDDLMVEMRDLIGDGGRLMRDGSGWMGDGAHVQDGGWRRETPLRAYTSRVAKAPSDPPPPSGRAAVGRERIATLSASEGDDSEEILESRLFLPSSILNRFRSKAPRGVVEAEQRALAKRSAPRFITMISAAAINCRGDSFFIAESILTDSRRVKGLSKQPTRKSGVAMFDVTDGNLAGTLFYGDCGGQSDGSEYRSVITLLCPHPILPSVVLIGDHKGFLAVADVRTRFIIWQKTLSQAEWSCAAWHPSGVEFVAGQLLGTFSVFTIFKPPLRSGPDVIDIASDDGEVGPPTASVPPSVTSRTSRGLPAAALLAATRGSCGVGGGDAASQTEVVFPSNPRFTSTPLIQFMSLDSTPVVESSLDITSESLQARGRRETGSGGRYHGALYDHHYSRQPFAVCRELQIVNHDRQSICSLAVPPAPFVGFYRPVKGIVSFASPQLLPVLRNVRKTSDSLLVTSCGLLRVCIPLPRIRPIAYPRFVTPPFGGPAITEPTRPEYTNQQQSVVVDEVVDIDWESSESSASEHSSVSSDDDDRSANIDDASSSRDRSQQSSATLAATATDRFRRSGVARATRSNRRRLWSESDDSEGEDAMMDALEEDDDEESQMDDFVVDDSRRTSEEEGEEARISGGAARNGFLSRFASELQRLDEVDFRQLPFEPCAMNLESITAFGVLSRMAMLMLSVVFETTDDEYLTSLSSSLFRPSLISVGIESPNGVRDLANALWGWGSEVGLPHISAGQWREALEAVAAADDEERRPPRSETTELCLICNKTGYQPQGNINRLLWQRFIESPRRIELMELIGSDLRQSSTRRITRRTSTSHTSLLITILTEYLGSLTVSTTSTIESVAAQIPSDRSLRLEEKGLELLGPFRATTVPPIGTPFHLHRSCLLALCPSSPVALRASLLEPFDTEDLEKLLRVRQGGNGRSRAHRRNSLGTNSNTSDSLCTVCGEDFAFSRCLFCTSPFHPSCALRTARHQPPFKHTRPARVMGGQEFIALTNSIICNSCVRKYTWPLMTSGGNAASERANPRVRDFMLERVQLGDIIRVQARQDPSSQLCIDGMFDAAVIDLQWRYGAYQWDPEEAHQSIRDVVASLPFSRASGTRAVRNGHQKKGLLSQIMMQMSPEKSFNCIGSTLESHLTLLILPPHQRAGDLLYYRCTDGLVDSSRLCILGAVLDECHFYSGDHVSLPASLRTRLNEAERKDYGEVGAEKSLLVSHPAFTSPSTMPSLLPSVLFHMKCHEGTVRPRVATRSSLPSFVGQEDANLRQRLLDDTSAHRGWRLRGARLLMSFRAISALMVLSESTPQTSDHFARIVQLLGPNISTAEVAKSLLDIVQDVNERDARAERLASIWTDIAATIDSVPPTYGAFLTDVPLPSMSFLDRWVAASAASSSSRNRNTKNYDLGLLEGVPEWLPSYATEVAYPVALATLYDRLKEGRYRDEVALLAELDLLVNNAIHFNGPEDRISQLAQTLLTEFQQLARSGSVLVPSYTTPLATQLQELYCFASSSLEALLLNIQALTPSDARDVLELSCRGRLPVAVRSTEGSEDDSPAVLRTTRRRRLR